MKYRMKYTEPYRLKRLKLWRVMIFLVIGTFHSAAIYAQTIRDHTEFPMRPIDPVEGTDILNASFPTKSGEPVQYITHRPTNRKDYVVTPFHWGKSPEVSRKMLINDAMQAITDARETYAEFGGIQSKLFYMLDERNWDFSNAYWITNNACWMRSSVSDIGVLNSGDRKKIFAHEIGHCLMMEKISQLSANYETLNAWFDESMAEFLSSLVYPTNNSEFKYALKFDLDLSEFRQAYNAYPLMHYYAENKGMPKLFAFLNQLAKKDKEITEHTNLNAEFSKMLERQNHQLLEKDD